MRVIEQQMNQAILNGVNWKNGNTQVIFNENNVTWDVLLYGNKIATLTDTSIQLFSAGYKTKTTKSRLNAILSVHGNCDSVYQKDGEWFVSTKIGRFPFTEGMILC